MARRVAIVAAALVALVSVAGCGGSEVSAGGALPRAATRPSGPASRPASPWHTVSDGYLRLQVPVPTKRTTRHFQGTTIVAFQGVDPTYHVVHVSDITPQVVSAADAVREFAAKDHLRVLFAHPTRFQGYPAYGAKIEGAHGDYLEWYFEVDTGRHRVLVTFAEISPFRRDAPVPARELRMVHTLHLRPGG